MAEDQSLDRPSVESPIQLFLRKGMPVFDDTGKKVGHIRAFNLEAGYLLVEGGTLRRRDYYIPLKAVRTLDRRKISLSMVEDQLARDDAAPPEARAIPEHPERAGSAEGGAVVWHEVPSGYDGDAVEVDPVDIEAVGRQVRIGMSVLDLLEDYMGEITRLDATRALMIVEHAYAGPPTLSIPYTAVASVDEDEEVVKLLRPRASFLEDSTLAQPAHGAPPGAGAWTIGCFGTRFDDVTVRRTSLYEVI